MVHRLWDFWKDPACGLVGTSVSLGGGTWRPPGGLGFKHGVENEEQLVHRGDERHLCRLTARAQALIKRPQHWIAPHRSNRGQIQDPAQPFSAALDLALPA